MRILVSRCLLGESCRYDGRLQPSLRSALEEIGFREEDLFAVCPECDGGLPVPRSPCELAGGSAADVFAGRARVLARDGTDKTEAFVCGARTALRTAESHGIRIALLKSRSPSCSPDRIYDGHFCGRLVSGEGLTASLLRSRGIELFSEETLDSLFKRARPHS